MTFLISNIETIIAVLGSIIAAILYVFHRGNLIDKGYEKAEKEIALGTIEAIKSAKQTEQAIKNLSDSELLERSKPWLRKDDTR